MTKYFCNRCETNPYNSSQRATVVFNVSVYNYDVEEEITLLTDAKVTNLRPNLYEIEEGFNTVPFIAYVKTTRETGNDLIDAIPYDMRTDRMVIDITKVVCGCGRDMVTEDVSTTRNNPLLRVPDWAENMRLSRSVESIHRFAGCSNFLKVFHIATLMCGLTSGRITRIQFISLSSNSVTISNKAQFFDYFPQIQTIVERMDSKIVIRRRKNISFGFENRESGNDLYTERPVSDSAVTVDLEFRARDFLSIPYNQFRVNINNYYLEDRDALEVEGQRDDVDAWFAVSQNYFDLDYSALEHHDTDSIVPYSEISSSEIDDMQDTHLRYSGRGVSEEQFSNMFTPSNTPAEVDTIATNTTITAGTAPDFDIDSIATTTYETSLLNLSRARAREMSEREQGEMARIIHEEEEEQSEETQ